jgi:hypothetical protein
MRLRLAAGIALLLAGAAGWQWRRSVKVDAAPPPLMAAQQLPGGASMQSAMVGHEFRQDDLPAIATGPDGSVWVAWLSFVGDRDDIAIRRYAEGAWGTMHWVPNTSGDSWLPQVAVDSKGGVWVVWSQQVSGNWDLYARRFDPGKQEWGALERLTNDPLPDINPRVTSDGKGRFAVVWQGFRGRNSSIFLKTFDGNWANAVRLTSTPANDWEPSVAFDGRGSVWVAYDSYRNGNYDVFLREVRGGEAQGKELEVAVTARMEARATVAVDTTDRVWVAWEEGAPNWGKDQGYILRGRAPGVQLGGVRTPRLRCFAGGQWSEPAAAVASAFQGNSYHPEVWSDGKGSVWVAAKVRKAGRQRAAAGRAARGYFEYWLTHLEGDSWSAAFALPDSRGRSSDRMQGTIAKDGKFWAAWPTDNRGEGFYHRPLRQAVHAGIVPGAGAGAAPVLKAVAADPVESTPAHSDEAADIRAVRAYRAPVGGKPTHVVRGDFHRHTELSWDGGGTGDGNLQDFYRYMIDVAAMDFGASTDHQGGAWPYWWWYTQKMTDMYHVPGAYVPIFGYERSATYPNGHRNVFFAKRTDSRVTPFFMRENEQFVVPAPPIGDEPGIGTGELVENDTKLLYEEVRGRKGLVIPHTSGTRMGTDWRDNDPALEPVVEIFQGARTNYESPDAPFAADPAKDGQHVKQAGFQKEGWVSNAWAKGYKLGIVSSSDHGSTHISYAMVYTADPSRQGVLDAIHKRHTYGAMDNILLDVRMGQYFMGDEFALTKALPIRVKARGARPIARVSVIKDNRVVYSTEPKQQNVELEYTDKDGVSGRHFYYVRVQQDNGLLAWSSPFFINYR